MRTSQTCVQLRGVTCTALCDKDWLKMWPCLLQNGEFAPRWIARSCGQGTQELWCPGRRGKSRWGRHAKSNYRTIVSKLGCGETWKCGGLQREELLLCFIGHTWHCTTLCWVPPKNGFLFHVWHNFVQRHGASCSPGAACKAAATYCPSGRLQEIVFFFLNVVGKVLFCEAWKPLVKNVQ